MNYQKDHSLSSLADVPLHIEDTLMKSVSYLDVVLKPSIEKTKDIAKLIKEMKRLNIKKKVTILTKRKKDMQVVTAKVDLDPETIKEWELLMVNDLPERSYANEGTKFKWKEIREMFQSRIDIFINQMHLLQGSRKFQRWKGSIVDSVVGVFLTQNVSDYLSSVAAKFPTDEPLKVNELVTEDQRPRHIGNNDAKSSTFIFLSEESIPEVEKHKETAKRKNKKTGIIEDEKVDWKSLRKIYTKEGLRQKMHRDSVDWNAVRSSGEQIFATTIRKRGQHNELARKILVDTNVGRIAVRLGWVPLEPLPDEIQMHQLSHYPSMDLIQKYLWPRLCKLSQETLYELHYQMITFEKVFFTKVLPNCNSCPMKSECKYFASAYVSSKNLLQDSEKKTQNRQETTPESDTFMPTYASDVDANMRSTITLIEECVSPGRNDHTNNCDEPIVEFPSSPRMEIPDLIDIEDTPCKSLCGSHDDQIPEIDYDMDALKKNVEEILLKGGKLLNSCEDEVSKALVVLTLENAIIPIKLPRKMKYYNRLRTEHVVYVLPDNHELLRNFERREPDDLSPYLLAVWQPGEMSCSFNPPEKKCNSDGSNLFCEIRTCSYCRNIKEQNSNVFRGTILIPCRTAMRGGFPLNGTYFQTNEVFADHETSIRPIVFPKQWCEGLEKRALYCGSSVLAICRFLDTRRIQLCFWTGFLCMRGFDRESRTPEELVRRLHTPPDVRSKKHMEEEVGL